MITCCSCSTEVRRRWRYSFQWRRNEINIAGARRGPKLEARRAEPGVGFLGRGGKPSPHQLRGMGSAVSSPSEVRGKAPVAKSFGAFWVLQVSSPAVLLLDLGVIHISFCCSVRKLLRGRKDTFVPAVSALQGRAPPLPPWFRRL